VLVTFETAREWAGARDPGLCAPLAAVATLKSPSLSLSRRRSYDPALGGRELEEHLDLKGNPREVPEKTISNEILGVIPAIISASFGCHTTNG
jgi:hypothetical protein